MKKTFIDLLHSFWEEKNPVEKVFFPLIQDSNERLAAILDIGKEAELSFAMEKSRLQDSALFRLQRRARLLSDYLLDEKGELLADRVSPLTILLKQKGYIPYPRGFFDFIFLEHILEVLQKIEKENLFANIKRFTDSLCSPFAERLIRDTFGLSKEQAIGVREVRKAVLSACFTALRQNVGSCFATAPAILVQQNQLELLLDDLHELLTKGRLHRTFRGKEYQVPLSPTFGGGDTKKLVLLSRQKESLLMDPGVMAAFRAAEIEEKKAQELLFLLEEKGPISIGDVIEQCLLLYFGVTKSDIKSYKKMSKSLALSGGVTGSLVAYLSREKMALVEEMEEKKRNALAAFKAMVDHPLLKAWEFSLASFADVKMEFSQWNLYISLGLNPKEEGGLGGVIYALLENNLAKANEQIEQYQQEYLLAIDQVRASEALLKRASTREEMRRLKGEFDTRLYHMHTCEQRRNQVHRQAELTAKFFPELIEKYQQQFPLYFQEIYDAEILDPSTHLYEDSPAGFRLVYKHGRSDATLWDQIYTGEEYIEALSHFFQNTETFLRGDIDEDLRDLLEEVTIAILHHLQNPIFLETALLRMRKQHLQEEDGVKKPWVYTSGGSMENLLEIYYQREKPVTCEGRWVDSPTDLLTHIINVLKTVPAAFEGRPLLMSSPTHAYILQPALPLLAQGWKSELFTYSWIRDEIIALRKKFFASMELSLSEQSFFIEQLLFIFPGSLEKLKKAVVAESSSISSFRSRLVASLGGSVLAEEKIDGLLYELLPLIPANQIYTALSTLTGQEKVVAELPMPPSPFITAKALREIALAITLIAEGTPFFSYNLYAVIRERGEKKGLFAPRPLFFADTNWPFFFFGFVVNPGTQELELWRIDPVGFEGVPMHIWRPYLNGSEKKNWNIYCNPVDYS